MSVVERWGRQMARRPVLLLTLGAILLRLLMLLGRGHYVAFDEGWYLLLGRNLWSGAGYTLSGLDHVTLSPLFPILAGFVALLIDDIVWAGRLVAAVCAGLLVAPCWYLFRRLANESVATLGALFVAVAPALAAFTVPFWIGWELWVGAEPVLHLFLFSGIALALRAFDRPSWAVAAACGAAFALAYLSRPEAIVVFALLGSGFVVASLRDRALLRPRLVSAVVCVIAFVIIATPYWLYLHDRLDRWTITGRGVEVVSADGAGGSGATATIERMLWEDEEGYVRRLYALNEDGTALASDYWGVRPDAAPIQAIEPADSAPDISAPRRDAATRRGDAPPDETDVPQTSAIGRYLRALLTIFPWYAWLFALIGFALPSAPRRREAELLIGMPLFAASVLIAVIIATDPRTQLFLVPLLAFYLGRGVVAAGDAIQRRVGRELRPSIAIACVAATLALVMVGVSMRRLYLSAAVGSPHHIVGAENAEVGRRLAGSMPVDGTIMSWHPALALYAERDWRVLPFAPMDRIVRYARLQPGAHVLLSVFYPPPILQGENAPHYLVVPIPADLPDAPTYRIGISGEADLLARGVIAPGE